jgi:short-subunit dehydrogenase
MGAKENYRGRWALVTGASSGIGVALARELAHRGAKLVLTARRAARLEALASELTARGVETRVVVADLMDPAAPKAIYDATEGAGVQIDVLINNAGLGQFGPFIASDAEQELAQVRVNCEAMVRLARLFVPPMVERRRGWVLIRASTASYQPLPYFATYAASKAFDRFFAQGLAREVERFGVKVTALCPGPTESEFFQVSRTEFFRRTGVQPVEEVARIGIRALERGRSAVVPNFKDWLTAQAGQWLPVSLVTGAVARMARKAGKLE